MVEELLEGEEVSVSRSPGPPTWPEVADEWIYPRVDPPLFLSQCLCFSDGSSVSPMPPAQDHKRLQDGDLGPNTGGMGAYCPTPQVSQELLQQIRETVLQKTVDGMKEEGTPYVGKTPRILVARHACRPSPASPHACLLDSRGSVCGADANEAGAQSPGVQLSLRRPRVSGGFL